MTNTPKKPVSLEDASACFTITNPRDWYKTCLSEKISKTDQITFFQAALCVGNSEAMEYTFQKCQKHHNITFEEFATMPNGGNSLVNGILLSQKPEATLDFIKSKFPSHFQSLEFSSIIASIGHAEIVRHYFETAQKTPQKMNEAIKGCIQNRHKQAVVTLFDMFFEYNLMSPTKIINKWESAATKFIKDDTEHPLWTSIEKAKTRIQHEQLRKQKEKHDLKTGICPNIDSSGIAKNNMPKTRI